MAEKSVPLTLPIQLMTMPRQFDTVFNGKIYVGKVDTDPTAEVNRIPVYQEAEDNTLVPIAQPIDINAGGYPVVGGQVVKLVVTEDYAIAVNDRLGAQAFYFPRCSGPYVLKVFHNQTLHGDGTEADPLGIELSKNAGNLLEIRDDGLYYGTSATDDLLNLYVDTVSGDDENIGSRAEPLKTLNEALKRTPWDKTNNIHLHAGQTFTLDINVQVNACTRNFHVYADPYVDGDKVPETSPENPVYYYWSASGLSRPTIKAKIEYHDDSHIANEYNIWVGSGGTITFNGIILDVVPSNDDENAAYTAFNAAPLYGDSTSAVNFFGCVMVTKVQGENQYKWVAIAGFSDGNMPSVNLCRCLFLSGDYFMDLSTNAAKVIVRDEWPQEFTVPYQKGNLVQATKDGKMDGIVKGPNGEPRNLMINFVI